MTDMKRYHFDDLTKINQRLGLLDDDTFKRFMADPRQKEKWFLNGKWVSVNLEEFSLGSIYRAKPTPLTKPHVPDDVWRVMPDWVAGVGKDSDETVWALGSRAKASDLFWTASNTENIGWLKGVTPGTCDWRDSWVPRPEGL